MLKTFGSLSLSVGFIDVYNSVYKVYHNVVEDTVGNSLYFHDTSIGTPNFQYFPKKTDFAKITNEEISKVEYLINSRPRKRFKGLTPYEMFYKLTGVAIDSWM